MINRRSDNSMNHELTIQESNNLEIDDPKIIQIIRNSSTIRRFFVSKYHIINKLPIQETYDSETWSVNHTATTKRHETEQLFSWFHLETGTDWLWRNRLGNFSLQARNSLVSPQTEIFPFAKEKFYFQLCINPKFLNWKIPLGTLTFHPVSSVHWKFPSKA